MNNKEFIITLAERSGFSQKDTQKLVNNIITAMSDAFLEGNSVSITNFGVFETKKKKERVIISPATGQRMLVPPKLTLSFKVNPTWKAKIKGGR